MNNSIILLLTLLLIFSACTSHKDHQSDRPNIILIQADDLGYDDIALHGNRMIETPNLDQLGTNAVRFENFHVSSVCAPTRAALLTGRNFLRTGVCGVHAGHDFVRLDETLISEVLQQNGYKTGMWGKWHSGKANGYFPWDRRFDEAYYALLYNYFDNTGLLNGEHVQTSGFTTDAITDMAIHFIEKNKGEPFFAYIPHLAPHNPWRAPEAYIEKYRQKGLSHAMATLYGMIDNLDYNIGRVIDRVDELGIADNTIIIFLSDNGPHKSSYRFGLTAEEWIERNPSGRRGNKGNSWENGIISPLFISAPSLFAPHIVDQVTKVEDLFPTLLSVAGIAIPDSLLLDGRSLLPALHGNRLSDEPVFVTHFSPKGDQCFSNRLDQWGNSIPFSDKYVSTIHFNDQRLALIREPYKYLQNENSPEYEIYNIINNPQENNAQKIDDDSLALEMKRELHAHYNNIVTGKSYAMPVFQIGYDHRVFNQVFAYAPSSISDSIMNMDLYSANWCHAGDYALFDIHVVTPGAYRVHLIHKIKDYKDVVFALSTEHDKTSSVLIDSGSRSFGTILEGESAYWENFDLIETFKKDIIKSDLGLIDLDKDDASLRLEIEALKQSISGGVHNQVISIQLIREE